MPHIRDVLITGGTGYLGRALSTALLGRGHRVRVLARPSSMSRVAPGAHAVAGDALDATSVLAALRPEDVVVHLVGTPHPSPAKAAEFHAVDLPSIRATVAASSRGAIAHLVYVSVAQPAPVMKAYLEVRAAGERLIAAAGLPAVVLRPWYVLGPGHWWPIVLLPLYWLASRVPALREGSRRLGLVTREQMVAALVAAVEEPVVQGIRVLEVPAIRKGATRVVERTL